MPEQPTPTVVCRVLGALAVSGTDGDVELRAEKLRRLLAELVLRRNTWVENDVLIDVLWNDAGRPQSARGNLKTYVHQLRQLLPNAANDTARILSRRGSYLLTLADEEYDAALFEGLVTAGRAALRDGDTEESVTAYQDALALWHGEPFTQVSNPRAEDEAERLRQLRSVAVEGLADALVAAGSPGEAAAVVRPLTIREPLREAGWRGLVAALRADGRPADALSAYHDARRALIAELGVEPGVELRELYLALLKETRHESPADVDSPAPHAPLAEPGAAAQPDRRLPRMATIAGVVVVLLVAGALVVDRSFTDNRTDGGQQTAAAELRDYSAGVERRRQVPGFPAAGDGPPKLLFGMGGEADTAAETKLVADAPVDMLTTWYDGKQDQALYDVWRTTLIPELYRSGRALHLVVPSWDEKNLGQVSTRYGPACGQPYPLSDGFLEEMRSLAKNFAGRADGPPLYVSMFHGLEKLACSRKGHDAGVLNRNYYRELRDRYLDVVKIFHANAPNARVGLNWDGWQVDGRDLETGGGAAMFDYFAEEMRRSDFVSVSAFIGTGNIGEIRRSVRALGKYAPVMLSYYRPYAQGGPRDPVALRTYDDDLAELFTPAGVRALTDAGLFAWGFWDDSQVSSTDERYERTRDVVRRYGRQAGNG